MQTLGSRSRLRLDGLEVRKQAAELGGEPAQPNKNGVFDATRFGLFQCPEKGYTHSPGTDQDM